MMEGELSSSCFICGVGFHVKQSPLMKRCDSFKDLREVVLRLCGLLNVEVTPEDWEGVDGDYLMKQTISCDKCFDILKNVERVHELLLKTQRELKLYLDEVEALIIKSESPSLQRSFWRSSCFKLRHSVLEKLVPAVNIATSGNSLQIEIKEESHGYQSAQTNYYEDQHVYNHFHDDDWVSSSPQPQLPIRNVNVFAEKDEINVARDSLQTPTATIDSLSVTTRKTRKRKITVIAEEDEVPQDKFPNIFALQPVKKSRGAKKIAEVALQLYTSTASKGEASDDDKEYNDNGNSPSLHQDLNEDNSSDHSEDESESKPHVEPALAKTRQPGSCENFKKSEDTSKNGRKQGHRIKIDNTQWRPFMYLTENVYLYRYDTYVLYTRSHLECQAYKCGFKTEFDFYSSFQRMRAHMEENHRSRKHRQRTPHPCVLCFTTFKNREDFLKHFYEKHSESNKLPRAVCECCLMVTTSAHNLSHMFTHKNDAEKADAIAKNLVPARCLKPKEREITEKKYSCPYENCTYTCKFSKNFERHKRRHLPKEERSDYTICPECGAHILKEYLDSHVQRLHHPETIDRCLLCNICGKRFLLENRVKYEAHLRTHTGEKPFLCTDCGMTYYDQAGLSLHIKNKHNLTPKEWPCEWCDMVYTRENTLRAHWRHKHQDKRQVNKQRGSKARLYLKDEGEEIKGEVYGPKQMFPCTICDVLCGQNYTLKKHMFNKHGIGELKKVPHKSPGFYRRKKEEN